MLERRYCRRIFQYQPLHEGLLGRAPSRWRRLYFNTSPSTRGFSSSVPHATGLPISIPAPPRGASSCRLGIPQARSISIPAPPRGASYERGDGNAWRNFNTSPSTRGFGPAAVGCGPSSYFNTSPSTRGFLTKADVDLDQRFNTSPSTRGFDDL